MASKGRRTWWCSFSGLATNGEERRIQINGTKCSQVYVFLRIKHFYVFLWKKIKRFLNVYFIIKFRSVILSWLWNSYWSIRATFNAFHGNTWTFYSSVYCFWHYVMTSKRSRRCKRFVQKTDIHRGRNARWISVFCTNKE